MTSTSHNPIIYKSPANNTNGIRKTFGPDGCQAVIDGVKCGETKNLQIIREFKQLYEDKMRQIDEIAGGDCIQAKVNLQQEWIKDLTDQNEMLVRVVEELEVEAAERVAMLESKLQQSAKCACEVMDSYSDFSFNFLGDLQKMEYVQSDLSNLLELIRRFKANGVWNPDGLRFYCINVNDIIAPGQQLPKLGTLPNCECISCQDELFEDNHLLQREDELKEKEKKIQDLEEQLRPYLENGKTVQDYKSMTQDYVELEKSMLDMRDALTAEVADKHDTVLCLRREVHLLEEQCRKSDQQTHFKDDIIKELRKEVKQLKQQVLFQSQIPNPQLNKSRSPRKKVHHSKTEPETNVNHLKDGTIVIRDTETVGDTFATQAIREKFSDPANQTIVYICESVPQKQKAGSRENLNDTKNMSSDVRNCDVSMDIPKNLNRSPNVLNNSMNSHMLHDLPRDDNPNNTNDLSANTFLNGSIFTKPSIQETCVQYSRDILDMLSQTCHMSEVQNATKISFEKCFELSDGNSLSTFSPPPQITIPDSYCGDFSDQPNIEEKCNVDFSNVTNCASERNGNEKDIGDQKAWILKEAVGELPDNIKGETLEIQGSVQLLFENDSLIAQKMSEKTTSHGVQTKESREKNTQTSRTIIGNVKTMTKTARKSRSPLRNKICIKNTAPRPKSKPACAVCGDDDTTLISVTSSKDKRVQQLKPRAKARVTWKDGGESSNPYNSPYGGDCINSREISFNEHEIRAFSSPYSNDCANADEDVIEIKKIFRGNEIITSEGKFKKSLYPVEETPRLPRRLTPRRSAIPIRPIFAEPTYRQPKPLSPRTLHHVPRYSDDIALSYKSQSLPSCAHVHQPRLVRTRYARSPGVVSKYNYVDAHYMFEHRNLQNKYAIDVGIDKKIVHSGYVDHWSHFDDTY